MTFKPAKCPNCAGDLQVPEDRDSVKCMYCGSDIVVREAIRLAGGVNVANLLELAQEAMNSQNYSEAFKYFSKVLEYDSNNQKAWLGKGFASLFMGKRNGSDILRSAIDKALSLTDNKSELKNHLINFMESFLRNYDYAKRFREDGTLSNNANLWDYEHMLNALAFQILELDSENIEAILYNASCSPSWGRYEESKWPELIIKASELAKDNLNYKIKILDMLLMGKNVYDFDLIQRIFNKFDGQLPYNDNLEFKKAYVIKLTTYFNKQISAAYEECRFDYNRDLQKKIKNIKLNNNKLWSLREGYIRDISALDNNYSPPQISNVKLRFRVCFIATAAYGSPLAQEVLFLKTFRDEHLTYCPLGSRFIDLYYQYSPPIAAFIDKSEVLKKITRACLAPIISLIKVYLKRG
jgi:hypothetical protein